MNRRQKEVMQAQLNGEKEIISKLEKMYRDTMAEVDARIAKLDEREGMEPENVQTIVYQRRYQQAIRNQIDRIIDNIQDLEFEDINDYLNWSYQVGYLGTMYDLHGQGIPIISPINQDEVTRAIRIDSKLSKSLYATLGEDLDRLKKSVRQAISRKVSQGRSWTEAAKEIAGGMRTPYDKAISYAVRIARTEGHRVQVASSLDAMQKAKDKGAEIVKQWDATLDGRTRPDHRKLDGQIRELDESFEVKGHKAKAPGHFGRPEEDINCRCSITQRARWALDEDELRTLEDRAAFFGLDKADDLEEFRTKYLRAAETVKKIEERGRIFANTQFTDDLDRAFGASAARETLEVIYDKLESCPIPAVAKIWQRHFHDFKVEKVRGGAYYSPGTGRVSFGAKYAEGKGGKHYETRQTFFHEVGHGLDDYFQGGAFKAGEKITGDGELGRVIFDEYTERVEKSMREALDRVNESWKKPDGSKLFDWLEQNGYIETYHVDDMRYIVESLYSWVGNLTEAEKKKLVKAKLLSENERISWDWVLTATKAQREKILPEVLSDLWERYRVPKKTGITSKIKHSERSKQIRALIDELKGYDRDLTSSLSDWLECLTNVEYPLGWGHGKKYWTRGANKYLGITTQQAKERELSSEAWAEMFEMCIGDPEAYEVAKKYFPKAVEWFEDKIKELEDEGF